MALSAAFMMLLLMVSSDIRGEQLLSDTVALNGKLKDGSLIDVVLRISGVSEGWPHQQSFSWGGDESSIPKRFVTAIEVKVGSERLIVPFSAYSDLGNPYQASLEKMKRGFKIILKGGDAAGSYTAELVFSKVNIQRRKVTHGEFPDEVWQETTYSFVSKDSSR